MLRSYGLYGYIKQNDLRATAMFGGFLLAFELAGLLVLLLPLMIYDIPHAPYPNPVGYLIRYVPGLLLLGGGLFLYRFFESVESVRARVPFRETDRLSEPRWFNAVQTQAIALGLPPPRVGLLNSPARNAFAFGLSPQSAVMVATRGLIDALDDEELEAVAALQAVHIRNGDIRLVAAAGVLLEVVHWMRKQHNVRIAGPRQILLAVLIPPMLLLFLAAWFIVRLSMTLARVSRLLIASSRQFVADAEAVRAVQNPAALISALRRIEGRSHVPGLDPYADAMMLDGATAGAYASHPPIAERIERLVQLTGDLAEELRPRRDTRPMELVLTHRPATFGRAGAPDPAGAMRAGLAERVNLDVDDESFGLTPLLAGLLVVGLCGVIAGKLMLGGSGGSIMAYLGADGLRANIQAMLDTETGTGGFIRDRRTLEAAAAGVPLKGAPARPTPLQAKCFPGGGYTVGDLGLRPLRAPDPDLVRRYSSGQLPSSSDVSLEHYLALKIISIEQVRNYRSGQLDQMLINYVDIRKAALLQIHRFYGRKGLLYMNDAYRTAADGEVLDMLRQRFQARSPALLANANTAADIELLVNSPGDFLPCGALAADP